MMEIASNGPEASGLVFFFISILAVTLHQKRKKSKKSGIDLESVRKKLDERSELKSADSFSRRNYFPLYMSLHEAFQKLERRIQLDEGKRGIKEILLPEGELLHAAVDIFHSKYVAVLTGFPCLLDYDPPTETDGPLGAVALVKALLLLGKKVVLLTDECNEQVLLACAAAANLHEYGATSETFSMQSFPATFSEADEARFGELYASIDLLISIERAGPNFEQKYLTMRKRDMTSIVAPLEYLALETAPAGSSFILRHDIKTIGIGDGGNEVGMGKVYDKILASKILNAKEIACVVSANHLIIASVSNWGGYALAAAMGLITLKQSLQASNNNEASSPAAVTHNVQEYKSFMVRKDLINETINKFLPTNKEEIDKCARIIGAGARDGISGKLEMMVDGMEIEKSLELMDEFRAIGGSYEKH